jgi:hypothetical protein
MSDPTYLETYLGNLLEAGSLERRPDEQLYALPITAYREDEPQQIGRWISEGLASDRRFTDLLEPMSRGDVLLVGLHPAALTEQGVQMFGGDVHQRVQDLFDALDTYWTRIHA